MQPQAAIFVNALKLLHSIEQDDLRAALGAAPETMTVLWRKFTDDPYRFLIKADDATAEAIWKLVEARQPGGPAFGDTPGWHALKVVVEMVELYAPSLINSGGFVEAKKIIAEYQGETNVRTDT